MPSSFQSISERLHAQFLAAYHALRKRIGVIRECDWEAATHIGLNCRSTGHIWGLGTVRPSTTACQRLRVLRIVILPFPLFLYPRVISQASREHHFTTGDLSRTDRRCGLRDFAQTLAVAVDHGNHDSPRPSRRCRRCLLRRCRYLRNLIPLHCPLPPFGPSPQNSHHTLHTLRDRVDPASLHCVPAPRTTTIPLHTSNRD